MELEIIFHAVPMTHLNILPAVQDQIPSDVQMKLLKAFSLVFESNRWCCLFNKGLKAH